MANTNIQIGIDLGTTNSEIAINIGDKIEIVKNIFGDEYTPSVFGVDKAKNKVVGKRAYERLYKYGTIDDVKNNKAEIKRLMGTSETVTFERPGVKMNAEEISSEILKSLKEDVLRKYSDFNTISAVITVPAYFSVLQSEATKRAGNLAGFKHVVLLQEPIAAAMSYGFMNAKNENWLIYDLGGGTFDVALISSKDGSLSVLAHNGDNFLGGKDFDWIIVDRVIVPKIIEKYSLHDFDRSNEKFRGVFAKLKYAAETAKINLSQYAKTLIEIDSIGEDEKGEEICLTIDFGRKDFEQLVQSLIDRTINLSKEVLKESGVKSSSVKRIILVGGPTQIPYIRERLKSELKIDVDTSVDPLTVVARGACVFALGQKVPKEFIEAVDEKLKKGTLSLVLNHESLTAETEETVSGIFEGLKESEDEYYVQIQSDSGFYSGSRIKLKNGKFFDTVALESNKNNIFWIYLFDKEGNSAPVNPDSFSITHGLSISGPPLPHSIGLSVAKRDIKNSFTLTEIFDKFFEKGSVLPLKKTGFFKTARRLEKNENDNPLWIKVGEGESEIPDRNTFICEMGIKGTDLPHDLPEGTDIEITIEITESRELFVTAYVPLIDLTVNARSTFKDELIDIKDIESELHIQEKRAKAVINNCSDDEQGVIESTIHSVNTSIQNASTDEDEKRKAHKQLKDLKITLDDLEKEKEIPQLIKEFNASIESAEKTINEYADQKDKTINLDQLKSMKTEGEKAIEQKDKTLLSRVNEQIKELESKAIYSNPSTWVYLFQKLTQGDKRFINEKEAQYYSEKGKRAIELNDIDELKRCIHNLQLLLPSDVQEEIQGNISGITH